MGLPYYHVDVFTTQPLSGNGLTVFTDAGQFTGEFMQRITQEMRQFESTFLQRLEDFKFRARVFTCEEELDFAGHPILGAAAIAHDLYFPELPSGEWEFQLNRKMVTVRTEKESGYYAAVMDQGEPVFGVELSGKEAMELLPMVGLEMGDLYPGSMPCVVSTGLPYLILPLQRNGERAKIAAEDLSPTLESFGAKFIGTLDVPSLSIRTWDNAGKVEDIATGSLAGPCGAWLVKHGCRNAGEEFMLHQGVNMGRPSELFVTVNTSGNGFTNVQVGGRVCKVAHGYLESNLIASYGN